MTRTTRENKVGCLPRPRQRVPRPDRHTHAALCPRMNLVDPPLVAHHLPRDEPPSRCTSPEGRAAACWDATHAAAPPIDWRSSRLGVCTERRLKPGVSPPPRGPDQPRRPASTLAPPVSNAQAVPPATTPHAPAAQTRRRTVVTTSARIGGTSTPTHAPPRHPSIPPPPTQDPPRPRHHSPRLPLPPPHANHTRHPPLTFSP